MLLGDSIASGFSIDKRENILSDKLQRVEGNYRRKQEKKQLKGTLRNKKQYRKYVKKGGHLSYDRWSTK